MTSIFEGQSFKTRDPELPIKLPQELRQLGDEAFLGGKRRPGALPIYDLEGSLGGGFFL